MNNSFHHSNIKGGDIGKYKLSDLNPLFQKAVKDLKPGEYSKIIKIKIIPVIRYRRLNIIGSIYKFLNYSHFDDKKGDYRDDIFYFLNLSCNNQY